MKALVFLFSWRFSYIDILSMSVAYNAVRHGYVWTAVVGLVFTALFTVLLEKRLGVRK